MHISWERLLNCLPWFVDNDAVIPGGANTARETEERSIWIGEILMTRFIDEYEKCIIWEL